MVVSEIREVAMKLARCYVHFYGRLWMDITQNTFRLHSLSLSGFHPELDAFLRRHVNNIIVHFLQACTLGYAECRRYATYSRSLKIKIHGKIHGVLSLCYFGGKVAMSKIAVIKLVLHILGNANFMTFL